jgi:hypothetical protein
MTHPTFAIKRRSGFANIPSNLILTTYLLKQGLTTVKKCDQLSSVSTSIASLDC